MKTNKVRRVVVASFVAAVLAASCSASDGGGEGATPSTTDVAQESPWSELPVYGRAVRPSVEEVTSVFAEANRAIEEFIHECMADKGFPGDDTRLDSGAAGAFIAKARPLSISDAEHRGLYLLAEFREATRWSSAAAEVDTQVPTLDAANGEAAMQAHSECIRSESARSFPRINALSDDYRSAVLESDLVAGAFAQWERCMSSAGYTARTLGDLRNQIKNSFMHVLVERSQATGQALAALDDEIFERERAAANAVVACDGEALVPIIGEWAALESAWLEENADAWNALSERDRYAVVPEM